MNLGEVERAISVIKDNYHAGEWTHIQIKFTDPMHAMTFEVDHIKYDSKSDTIIMEVNEE